MKKKISILVMIIVFTTTVFTPVFAGKKVNYNKYSNRSVGCGLNLRTDHKLPAVSKPAGVSLKKYHTYYYGSKAYRKKKKVIYLTFDCGYENGNTKKILKILKKKKIKAIFFVTEPYIKENTKLVKQMKKQGHLVGNHTCTHPRLPDISVGRMKKELKQCRKTMKKLTGYNLDSYMRPPEGEYSVRVMKVAKDMGYNTMLWSLALYDYDVNNQPAVSYVVDKFKKHHFCGMMPLLHVISSADTKALPKIISYLKKQGYRFGTVDEFAKNRFEKKE
ncbi:MAG: polysaccharide deacetylase family protein [Eubacterium sp.]|nr:polysaccharide deacetylase family protein [Eubacterium sp.]